MAIARALMPVLSANFFAGITYQVQGNLIDAIESLGWAARSPEFRAPAYAQMAAIELNLNNKELTEHYANLALDFDRYNFNALQVLDKAPAHPLITIWKAYLNDDASLLNEVAVASPAYVFPYRTETVSALTWALSKNNSWKFKYYLVLNYFGLSSNSYSILVIMSEQLISC